MEFDIDQLNGMRTYDRDTLSQLVQDVEDGNESALKAFAILKKQADFIKQCIDQIEPIAFDEAERYGEKTFEDHGYKFEIRKGGAMWSFKNCPNWVQKKEELQNVEKMLKAAAESHEFGTTSVDENGEVLTLPEKSYRKDSIVVK